MDRSSIRWGATGAAAFLADYRVAFMVAGIAVNAVGITVAARRLCCPAAASTLEVGGAQWPVAAWDGDPPSGHHRTGTLRFTPAGAATGTVTLTVGGLSEPATFSWSVGGS